MPTLGPKPSITDIQKYVAELEIERGFERQDVLQKCLLLGEEVGELFKSIRKQQKMSLDPLSKVGQAADEISDILIMLCSIANRLDVDMEQSFRAKEEINKARIWTVAK